MLSTDLKSLADKATHYAATGITVGPDEVKLIAALLRDMARTAEALEATKVSQEVADRMADLLAEHRELRG